MASITDLKVGPYAGPKPYARIVQPIAASQKFHPHGGKWIYLDANGHGTFALTNTGSLFGWALVPRGLEAGTTAYSNGYWTSSATAAADSCVVIKDLNTIFCMGVVSGISMAQARVGELSDIEGTNNGTRQLADPGTSTQDVLTIMGWVEANASYCLVRMNPEEEQADT